jgi:hypothetical protein
MPIESFPKSEIIALGEEKKIFFSMVESAG